MLQVAMDAETHTPGINIAAVAVLDGITGIPFPQRDVHLIPRPQADPTP